MNQLGNSQPQHNQLDQQHPQLRPHGTLMTGPDGVVYAITSAGAVPVAQPEGAVPREIAHGQQAPHGQPRRPGEVGPCFSYSFDRIVSWCFSYSSDGINSACFSYSPDRVYSACFSHATDDAQASLPAMPVWACFSYSPDSEPGSGDDTAATDPLPARPAAFCFSYSADSPSGPGDDATAATDPLPSMPVTCCFSYSHAADQPPRRADHDTADDAQAGVRRMPGSPCFSYGTDVPRRMPVHPCFSYGTDVPRMPHPCFSYGTDVPRMPYPCFSFDAILPPGIGNRRATRRAPSSVRQMPGFMCFSYTDHLPHMPVVSPCFSYLPDSAGDAGPFFGH